jgi:hypothetical protein
VCAPLTKVCYYILQSIFSLYFSLHFSLYSVYAQREGFATLNVVRLPGCADCVHLY